MVEFNNLAKFIQNERLQQELKEKDSNAYKMNCLMGVFGCWCRAFQKKPNEYNFKQFLREEKKKLTFWQRKYILEHYFNYKFYFNKDMGKWISQKKQKEINEYENSAFATA